jgi:type I restriction enzyme R subunit
MRIDRPAEACTLLKRIGDAGQLKRALFVCDRNELQAQALKHFQNVFGSDAAEVYRKPDGTNNAKNARVHIATYQTLGVDNEDDDGNFLTTHYPPDYFSHVVIDECHRSAWGKWSQVLTRNASAAQIGLTATPRRLVEKLKEAVDPYRHTPGRVICWRRKRPCRTRFKVMFPPLL